MAAGRKIRLCEGTDAMSWKRRSVALLATATLLLAGCGGGGGDGGEGEGGGTIRWWHIQNTDPMLGVWQGMADEFVAANEGTTVDILPLENEAFKARLTTAMQAADPPDLFQTWGGGVLRQQAEAGLVKDITDAVQPWIGQISPGALKAYTIDDRIYGIPFDAGMVGFWYNQALFDEAGIAAPPTTWTEFLAVVQQIQDAGITPIAVAGADKWPVHFYLTYLMMRTAGLEGLRQAAANRDFNTPDLIRAAELLQELVALEPFQDGYLGATYGDGAESQAATMGNGQAAMELMGQWAPSVQASAAGNDGLGEDLKLFTFPVVEGGKGSATEALAGGNGFAVGVNAPDSTLDFLEFLFGYENQRTVVDTATVTTVAADPTQVMDEVDPHVAMVLETLAQQTGTQLYLDQDYPPAVGQQINDASVALIAGEMTPEEVMQSITEVWQSEP